ncbi:MAG: hypothetical protein DIU75_019680 [Mycolicibacterium hassiacum]|nr:hypothetical protein [Vulgatibacteraceae bacterium]
MSDSVSGAARQEFRAAVGCFAEYVGAVAGEVERERLARELLRLGLPELVDVLRRVLPAHEERDNADVSTLVLAEVSRVLGDDQPVVEVVAWPDREHYGGALGAPALYEQGRCPGCGLEVTSTVKRAHCPACGMLCHLT